MNSAFDELFAAAERGDSAKSAMIEAKMAAEAASLATIEPAASSSSPTNNKFNEGGGETASRRNSSRPSSFRNRPRAFSRLLPNRDPNLDPALVYGDYDNDDRLHDAGAAGSGSGIDRASRYLGSPQQLTRSVSCKRPGSFKKVSKIDSG